MARPLDFAMVVRKNGSGLKVSMSEANRPQGEQGEQLKITFCQWLKTQTKREDPIGDLARDARDDRGHKGNTIGWWKDHLRAANACDGAFDALEEAFEEFRKSV